MKKYKTFKVELSKSDWDELEKLPKGTKNRKIVMAGVRVLSGANVEKENPMDDLPL